MVQLGRSLALRVDITPVSTDLCASRLKKIMGLSLLTRSVLSYEEGSSTQEGKYTSPTVPAYSKPDWNEVT